MLLLLLLRYDIRRLFRQRVDGVLDVAGNDRREDTGVHDAEVRRPLDDEIRVDDSAHGCCSHGVIAGSGREGLLVDESQLIYVWVWVRAELTVPNGRCARRFRRRWCPVQEVGIPQAGFHRRTASCSTMSGS